MTVQVKRHASRCHWLMWLSAAVFLASFSSAKGITSPQHSLSAAYEDDAVQRQLRGNGLAPTEQEGDNVEERGPLSIETSSALFDKIVTSKSAFKVPSDQYVKLWKWMHAVKNQHPKGVARLTADFQPSLINHIRAVMELKYGHEKAHKMWLGVRNRYKMKMPEKLPQLNELKAAGRSDEEIMLEMLDSSHESSMLTDSMKRDAWIVYTNEHVDKEVPYATLFLDMQDKYDFKEVVEFAGTVIRDSSNNVVSHAAKQLQASLYKHLHDRGESPDVLYERFEFNNRLIAMERPASLDFWAGYARMNKMENVEENLFAKLLKSYPHESDLAFGILQSAMLKTTPLADNLLKLLVERWLTNGTFREFSWFFSMPGAGPLFRAFRTHKPDWFANTLLDAMKASRSRSTLPQPSA